MPKNITFAIQIFGKRFSDLTAEQKREFYRLQKKKNRKNNPERAKREREYAIEYARKNADKIAEYRKKYKQRRAENKKLVPRKHCKTTLVYELFGEISFKDLSLEQKRKYYSEKQRRYLRRNFGATMAEIEKREDFIEKQ